MNVTILIMEHIKVHKQIMEHIEVHKQIMELQIAKKHFDQEY